MIIGLVALVLPMTQSRAGIPVLRPSPTSALVGQHIKVTGSNLPAGAFIQLFLDGSSSTLPSVRVSSRGTISAAFTVPKVKTGSHTLSARSTRDTARRRAGSASASTVVASATLVVVDRPAQPTPDPTIGGAALVETDAPTDSPTATPTATPTVAPTSRPATVAPATPEPVSASGIPPMPAGDLLRKSFADGTLAPFRVVTYPNDHPGDAMSYACHYGTDKSVVSVHNGYLELKAYPAGNGKWNCGFVSTGMDGKGGAATFSFKTGYVQFAAQVNAGHATWQDPLWLLNTVTGWHAAELDAAEVIDGRLTWNVHGPANVGVASRSAPSATSWHVYGIAKASDHVTLTMDGEVVGRWNGSMPDPMALLADSKVGFQWEGVSPNGSTPNPAYSRVAWITVSSKIPSGL